MKYLPYEDFEIHSELTSDEVFYKLRAAVDTQRKWWIFTNKPFWGEVDRHYFRIWRANWSGRGRLIVTGRIQANASGSCIRVRIRLTWFDYLFWTIWLGGIWFIFYSGIANLLIQKIQTGVWEVESPWDFLPTIGMFAFGYLLLIGFFKYDANYIKEYLLWLSGVKKENLIDRNLIFGLTEAQIMKWLLTVTFITSFGWILFNLL